MHFHKELPPIWKQCAEKNALSRKDCKKIPYDASQKFYPRSCRPCYV